MDKQSELNKMEGRQLELLSQMRASDAHSSKCQKLGLVFSETYPLDYAAYEEANAEYNANELKVNELEKEIEEENEQLKAEEL